MSRRAIAKLYERVARVNRNTLSLLQAVQHKLLIDEHRRYRRDRKTSSETWKNVATTRAFTRSAVKSIDYVNSLVQDSLRFVIRDLATNATTIAEKAKKNDKIRTFLSRIFRKCVRSMSRLFVERVLRARALAMQRRLSNTMEKQFVVAVTNTIAVEDKDTAVAAAVAGDTSSTTNVVPPTAADTALPPSPPLSCPVCKRSFEKTFHYLQHIRVHYRLNLYVCERCRETFVQQNGLDYHRRQCCPASAAAETYDSKISLEKRDDDKVIFYRDSSRKCRSFRTTENRRVRSFELCESCDAFHEHGPVLRNHVLRAHATRNIDLGVNRTQQLDMENLLNSYDATKRRRQCTTIVTREIKIIE